MPVVKNTFKGAMALGIGSAAFFIALLLWAFLSGGINGLLAGIGFGLPDKVLLAVGPLLGLAAAGWAITEVFD